MEEKKLKKLWTDVAKGKVSTQKALDVMEKEKTQPQGQESEKQASGKGDHTRKRVIKSKEVK